MHSHLLLAAIEPVSRARLIDHAMTTDPIDAQVFEKPPPVIITYSVVVRGSCGPRVGARWAIEMYTRCTRTRFAIAYAFCASHMHYFAMVYATAIRVCTRVYSFSLPLSLFADPSAIPSSLSLSLPLPVALVGSAVHARFTGGGGTRAGGSEMRRDGRERKEDAVGTLAREGGRGARAVLSACVSDVLMTLRNTEQANQYGSRHSCTRRAIASFLALLNRSLPRERELATGEERGKREKKKEGAGRPLSIVTERGNVFEVPWIERVSNKCG